MATVINDEQAIQNVSDNVSHLLSERRMSQAELARATKETEMSISRLVRGSNMPGVAILARVAETLGVSVDYLLSSHPRATKKKSRNSA